ncbi:MAG: serine/threonine protein kinase [Xanthomonadales bacterium]|nr:serine/threonine protein kinase [Xanthomonadales bacterium]
MDGDAFARLRAAFHELAELDNGARAAALAAWQQRDSAFAAELVGLFAAFDPRDLAAAALPSRFGPFRVLARIGGGGMGEVFLAERDDGAYAQRVAIKRIRRDAIGTGLDARFLRERGILARLEHPGIVALLDGGVDADGRPWFAMRHVEGLDLAAWVSTTRPRLRERVALFVQVLDALAHAHRALVVHRDLKPGNILVDAAGAPHLLDFGIAKLLDDDGEAATRAGGTAMTLRYAAPEQVLGDRVTTLTDVHAAGVVLYELLARHSPFAAAESGAVGWQDAIVQGAVRPLAEALGDSLLDGGEQRRAARELAPLVAAAMATSPAARYAGASQFADDLRDWLAGRAPRSGLGSWRLRAAALWRRHRLALGTAAAATLALATAAVVAWNEAREARRQAQIAEAHVAALIGVLAAANPMRFAGRDPTASEFLVAAAAQLRRDHGDEPALLFRALGEIGHGLLNLGRFDAARPVLQEALLAADRAPAIAPRERLGYLKLLALALDTDVPDARAQAADIAARIEQLARLAPDSGAAADALACIAAVLSRLGATDHAAALFARAVAALGGGDASTSVRENVWRQKGWAALRRGDAEAAARDFERMRTVIAAAPGEFSPLRAAEAELLSCEAALDQGDAAAATAHFARAAAVMFDEYAVAHPERRALLLVAARTHWLAGDLAAAQTDLSAARDPAYPPPSADEAAHLAWLGHALRLAAGTCATPPAAAHSPRLRLLAAQVQARAASCPDPND